MKPKKTSPIPFISLFTLSNSTSLLACLFVLLTGCGEDIPSATHPLLSSPSQPASYQQTPPALTQTCPCPPHSWEKGYCCSHMPLQKAWSIKEEADQDNQADLRLLADLLDKAHLSVNAYDHLKNETKNALERDRKSLIAFRDLLGSRGSFPLKTSLRKLIGTDTISGILEDASQTLEHISNPNVLQNINITTLKNNQITVIKTLFIYMNTLLEGVTDIGKTSFLPRLHIIYPAEIPADLYEKIPDTLLLQATDEEGKKTLWVPNAGYIFGGVFQGAQHKMRGVDCSAYVSVCVDATDRLVTSDMRYAQQGEIAQKDGVIQFGGRIEGREEIYHHVRDELDPITTESVDDLRPGDLVMWPGHVVMFNKKDDSLPNHFWGIELTREDDKSKEGFIEQSRSLVQEGKELFVLRRNYERSEDPYLVFQTDPWKCAL